MSGGQGSTGNVIAALCAVFPGFGHLVQGRILLAVFYFVSLTMLYVLGTLFLGSIFLVPYVPAVALHLWSIVSAARFERR